MKSAEMLAKMTAKGLVITGEGFGGETVLSAADVAGALASVRGVGYDLLLVKYAEDYSRVAPLISTFTAVIEAKENKSRPGSITSEFAGYLARAIIADNLGGDLCSTCNGTGTHRYKNCTGCNGSGKRPPSATARATSLGLTRYEYKKFGLSMFNRYAGLLCEWEYSGLAEVSRNLSRFSDFTMRNGSEYV